MIHLYKLRSGETVIAVLSSRVKNTNNEREPSSFSGDWVETPMLVNSHLEIVGPWAPGMEVSKHFIPTDFIVFYVNEEIDGIEESLLREYKELIQEESLLREYRDQIPHEDE